MRPHLLPTPSNDDYYYEYDGRRCWGGVRRSIDRSISYRVMVILVVGGGGGGDGDKSSVQAKHTQNN